MRLIDANLLEKFFYKEVRHYPFSGDVNCILVDHVLHTVRNFPTIDAVPVVRCKDCKYNPEFKTKIKGWVWCRNFRTEVDATGFCSYGKPRGERKE